MPPYRIIVFHGFLSDMACYGPLGSAWRRERSSTSETRARTIPLSGLVFARAPGQNTPGRASCYQSARFGTLATPAARFLSLKGLLHPGPPYAAVRQGGKTSAQPIHRKFAKSDAGVRFAAEHGRTEPPQRRSQGQCGGKCRETKSRLYGRYPDGVSCHAKSSVDRAEPSPPKRTAFAG